MSGMMHEYADGGDNGGDNDDAYVMPENNEACGEYAFQWDRSKSSRRIIGILTWMAIFHASIEGMVVLLPIIP